MSSEQNPEGIRRVENSAQVFAQWRQFRGIYNNFAIRIENRWRGMTMRTRRDLLNQHWISSGDSGTPMPMEDRPDLMQIVPWRDPLDKNRTFNPTRSVNPEFLRWPNFSLERLTRRPETFFQLMFGRARQHPKQFAHVDHFGENAEIAVVEGLLIRRRDDEFDHPMAEIQTTNFDEVDRLDNYGSVHNPSDPDDFQIMLEDGLWLERHARELMVIQLRIYKFLRMVVFDIANPRNDGRFRVANETTEVAWRYGPPGVPRPDDNGIQDDDTYQRRMDDYRGHRDNYIEHIFTIMPYTGTLEDVGGVINAICSKRSDDYEWKLQGLKARPDHFFRMLFDVHEHSMYVLRDQNGETHPWADLTANDREARMWATLLKQSLYMVTEGIDTWQTMLRTFEIIRSLDEGDDAPEGSLGDLYDYLAIFYKMASDRLRLVDLRKTLACSSPLRHYFRKDGQDANAEPIVVQRGSANDIKNTRHAQLVTLLRAITEQCVDQRIPHDRLTWGREIIPLLDEEDGSRWITDYGDWKAEEFVDTSFLWMMFKRSWDYDHYDAFLNPDDQKYNRWRDHKRFSDNLRAIDIEEFVTIVKNHMLPPPSSQNSSTEDSSPQDLFYYPSTVATVGNMSLGKKRHNAGVRMRAERRLRDLWADLQPMLQSRDALSPFAIAELNQVRPSTTRRDGVDITPTEPPPPPPPLPPAIERPSTPPQAPGPDPPVTPLRNLSINAPQIRPPPIRTPERRTDNGGITKPSPIRRALPGEGGPRRPQIDRRAERQVLEAAAAAEPVPVVQAPPPPADPGPVVERPKIRLPTRWYNLLQRIMVSDGEQHTSHIDWADLRRLMNRIGFNEPREGLWEPSDALQAAQGPGVSGHLGHHRPHGASPYLTFAAARRFFRGNHGIALYGWDFSKFEDAGAPP